MKNEILFMISSLINKFSICGKKLWLVQFKCEVEQRYCPSGRNPLIPSIHNKNGRYLSPQNYNEQKANIGG